MNKQNKKSLLNWALNHLEKTQVLPSGLYQSYEVKAKYGQELPDLPKKYTLILISHFPFENKQKHF